MPGRHMALTWLSTATLITLALGQSSTPNSASVAVSTTNGSGSSSSATPTFTEPCLDDSSQASCANYQYPDANATSDINNLCALMPDMIGCTLANSCKARNNTSGYCNALSLLGNICLDMPKMGGCRRYNALCKNTTRVQQCTQQAPLPNVLESEPTVKAILTMCSSHSMDGCQNCTNADTNCPQPLVTIAKLCWGMSGMANCTAFYKMCSTKDAQSAFPTICDNGQGGSGGGGSDPEYIPPMTMWFHQRVQEVILFVEWIPRTTAAYVGSWFAVFFISVTTQALKAGRVVAERRWYATARQQSLMIALPQSRLHPARYMTRHQLQRNVARSALTGIVSILEYSLMLIVMIYNIGLFFAVVVGLMVGSLLFGHVAEGGPAGGDLATDHVAYGIHGKEAVDEGPGAYVSPTAVVVGGAGCHCDP